MKLFNNKQVGTEFDKNSKGKLLYHHHDFDAYKNI